MSNSKQPTSPAAQLGPCLIKIRPIESTNNLLRIENDEFDIGRDIANDLVIPTVNVSLRHAKIYRRSNQFFLLDLNSQSGTFLNSTQIIEHRLRAGNRIRIGDVILKFLPANHVELEFHEAMQTRVVRDGLTQSYNKTFMLDFLERELARCFKHDRPLSVLMMDIDHFKQVNDTHGHYAGDQVLVEFSKRIAPLLDADDIFSRYGGEEFAVVMCENDHRDALELADTIRAVIGTKTFETDSGDVPVTVSIGITSVTGSERRMPDPSVLIQQADEMLYCAKQAGRDCVRHREYSTGTIPHDPEGQPGRRIFPAALTDDICVDHPDANAH